MYALYTFEQKNVNDSLLKIDFFRKKINSIHSHNSNSGYKRTDLVTTNISLLNNVVSKNKQTIFTDNKKREISNS